MNTITRKAVIDFLILRQLMVTHWMYELSVAPLQISLQTIVASDNVH